MTAKANLLLVDDDRHLLDSMAGWLREQHYDVATAATAKDAIAPAAPRTVDLALVDIPLDRGVSVDVLGHCRQRHPHPSVILIAAYSTVETGVEALRAGAFDLLTKPLLGQELLMAIERA